MVPFCVLMLIVVQARFLPMAGGTLVRPVCVIPTPLPESCYCYDSTTLLM